MSSISLLKKLNFWKKDFFFSLLLILHVFLQKISLVMTYLVIIQQTLGMILVMFELLESWPHFNQKFTSNVIWVSATVSFIWPTTIIAAALKISQAVTIDTALSLISIAFIQAATAGLCSGMVKTTRERLLTTLRAIT